jgi:hypothetical protein
MLLQQRTLARGMAGVCPVISSTQKEALGRQGTIVEVLNACGMTEAHNAKETLDGLSFQATGGPSGGYLITFFDSQAHRVECHVKTCSIRAAVGFTGICGFCDEVDTWRPETSTDPADKVIESLFDRLGTQPEARMFLVSASYARDTEHARMVERGDTPLVHVARLGDRGASLDEVSRLTLLLHLRDKGVHLTVGEQRLLAERADKASPDVPSWATNPIANIKHLYTLSGSVARLLQKFGGRRATWARTGMRDYEPVDLAAYARANSDPEPAAYEISRGAIVPGGPTGKAL